MTQTTGLGWPDDRPLVPLGSPHQPHAGQPLGDPAAVPAASQPAEPPLLTLDIRRDGRTLVGIRCIGRGTGVVVECSVLAVGRPHGAAPEVRSYGFPDLTAAEGFAREIARTLEYLGCDVA